MRVNKEKTTRSQKAAAKRRAILEAAREEFIKNGFALATVETIAQRAGVGKGTVYLYFPDKETLFTEMIHTTFAAEHVDFARMALPTGHPAKAVFADIYALALKELRQSGKVEVLRLLVSEGSRFPGLASLHYAEGVSRALAPLRTLLARAAQRGELRNRALVNFPQIIAAPLALWVVWQGIFGHVEPLDIEGMLKVYLDSLFEPGHSMPAAEG